LNAFEASVLQENSTMSLNPDVDRNSSRGQQTFAAPSGPLPVFSGPSAYELPAPPQSPPWEGHVVGAPARVRRGWIAPAAIALIGLIASGTLGGFLVATLGQRDTARHQLTSTQTTLAASEKKLAAATANDAYVHVYAVNSGLITTEYQNLILCDVYVTCRAAAQNILTDMTSFQAARANAAVPPALGDADSQVGAALIAGIAADKELTSAMDAADTTRIQEGFKKLDTAMLAFAKAESAVAASIS
jgi:hypothetical protein